MEEKYILWSNYPGVYADSDLNDIDFEVLLHENDTAAEIIAIADLGLWNGRVHAVRELNNVQDCFWCGEDYAEFSVDSLGDLRCKTSHHDGTNYILFRVWKDEISEDQRDNFIRKFLKGAATRKDINRYTSRISVADPFH